MKILLALLVLVSAATCDDPDTTSDDPETTPLIPIDEADLPLCPEGSPQTDCFGVPCEMVKCLRYPDALCTNDYCHGCRAWYYLNGVDVTNACRE